MACGTTAESNSAAILRTNSVIVFALGQSSLSSAYLTSRYEPAAAALSWGALGGLNITAT